MFNKSTNSLVFVMGLAFALPNCSQPYSGKDSYKGNKSNEQQKEVASTATPTQEDPQITIVPAGVLPMVSDHGDRIALPGGEYIAVKHIAGVDHIAINAVIGDVSFQRLLASASQFSVNKSETVARLNAPLEKNIAKIQKFAKMVQVTTHPEYGFFSALIPLEKYRALQDTNLHLESTLLINPVVNRPMDKNTVRTMSDALKDGRNTAANFSGLERMGVSEFLELAEADIGQIPSGSNVMVGVADTGITFNHPSFYDGENKSRIAYMRDFTGEGRMYFNPNAKFEIKVEGEQITLTAEVVSPVLGTSVPGIDQMETLADRPLLLSDALKAKLMAANSGAKLGLISEASFANASEKVDINYNGKTDDNLFAILLPSEDSYEIYLSPVGNLDFRTTGPIKDWSTSKDSMAWGSEKIGLDIRTMTIADSKGEDVEVVTASIVGFDAGNHGTHVSGIIGGLKTIANDDDNTLARGAAPDVNLMVNRVCANNGGCRSTEAFIDLADAGAEIINMSLGGLSAFNDGYSVQEVMIDRLTQYKNVLFVISAGNSGPGINTIGSPSTAKYALSIGATGTNKMMEAQYQWAGKGLNSGEFDTERDFVMHFSSRGPNAAGGFKPDITAPGSQLSAIQLNNAAGSRSGNDVYWGTSMAAPAASGAIALLIDAAKIYNAKNPENILPLDALTIRSVVKESARPFEVNRFDPKTGVYTEGQYTWIDQGTGMINLPSAWKLLKAIAASDALESAVNIVEDGVKTPVTLAYQPRVLAVQPNGGVYDGSRGISPSEFDAVGPAFGQGIWIDAKAEESLVKVQIARRLPLGLSSRDDFGELRRQLITTQDKFALEIVYYGSNKEWLKVGVLDTANCAQNSVENRVFRVIGEGATDVTVTDGATSGTGTSAGFGPSTLSVCIDRKMTSTLNPGDHGALIKAFRVSGDQRDLQPSFVVPVYMTQAHKTMAGKAAYQAKGSVGSMVVDRHYVSIPEGVSLVTVELELPEAKVRNNVVTGCMGARLYAKEAANTSSPQELSGKNSIYNCTLTGGSLEGKNKIRYQRNNPKSGIWELHVFGLYRFEQTDYKLTVKFANINLSQTSIEGSIDVLDGKVELEVLNGSMVVEPSSTKSSLVLDGLQSKLTATVGHEQEVNQPNVEGVVFRTYAPEVEKVEVALLGAIVNDLDFYVLECETEDLAECARIAMGATSTSDEKAEFAVKEGKMYVVNVQGYSVVDTLGEFVLTETTVFKDKELGAVSIRSISASKFEISHIFDAENSVILKSEKFLSGVYAATGSLELKSEAGDSVTHLPVLIKNEGLVSH